MSMKDVYGELLKYKSVMRLNPPATQVDIKAFEVSASVKLPEELKALYLLFDGGEIFVPGTKIFGLRSTNKITLSSANSGKDRSLFHIPNNYILFAKLNYGDFICINTDALHDVIQWDHEADEEFVRWNSLETWLKEAIEDYRQAEGGEG